MQVHLYIKIHARIQEFLSGGGGGGGPGQSDKKKLLTFFFFFYSPQLIFTEVKRSIAKKSIIFQGFRGGPTFSRGVQLFPGGGGGGGGGSNCLFPIETHISCDFPGRGVRTPCPPPSGSALEIEG